MLMAAPRVDHVLIHGIRAFLCTITHKSFDNTVYAEENARGVCRLEVRYAVIGRDAQIALGRVLAQKLTPPRIL